MKMLNKERKIFGHQEQEKILAKSISSSKLFPFWIFYGARGIGKFSVALKFAKCLLTNSIVKPDSLDLDEKDEIHKLVDNKIHPDCFIIDDLNPSTEMIRDVISKVRMSPSLSTMRVVIIKNSENMNKTVCNSLLKILEEPPKNAIFILTCANIGNLPITLLSRASKLYFDLLSREQVRSILELNQMENAEILAKISGGSVGNAIYLSQNNSAEIYENILKGFSFGGEEACKTLAYVVNNNLCENFKLVKDLIILILKSYVDCISGVNSSLEEEQDFFRDYVGEVNVDYEVEKVLKIITQLNRGEIFQLDKKALFAEVFETFFEKNLEGI